MPFQAEIYWFFFSSREGGGLRLIAEAPNLTITIKKLVDLHQQKLIYKT